MPVEVFDLDRTCVDGSSRDTRPAT